MADTRSAILLIKLVYVQLAEDGVCAVVTGAVTLHAQLIVPVVVFNNGDNTIEPPDKAVPADAENVNVIKPLDTVLAPYAPD